MNILETKLAKRLISQKGRGRGATFRQFLKWEARHGRATLPSGFGVTIKVEAWKEPEKA